jgi:hypothetical protein
MGSGRHGAADIKAHPFFVGFDWDALAAQTIKAPFQPTIRSREDLSNFEEVSNPAKVEVKAVRDNSGWDAEF